MEPCLLRYTKLNRNKQDLKTLKAKQLDSTYTNATDPNTMRDQGRFRNAEYTFAA